MSKNNENKLVPKLRFPEFLNDGEWIYVNGNELFEPIVNKNHNSDLPILAITQEQGAIPRDMIDYHVSVTDKSVESYKVVEVGDFIISLRSFQGGIEYSQYKGLCSPAYIILRKKTALENEFYRHYFKSKPFIRDLNKNLEGIRDGKMISYKQFSEILIPKPKPNEQQKIAACLSSLDEVITAESQKLEVLKEHKKGLLQNLLPSSGTGLRRLQDGQDKEEILAISTSYKSCSDNVPKFRFKEFEDSGEWVEKKLGEVANFSSGGTPSKDNSDYWNGDIPWISASSMHNQLIETSELQVTNLAINNGTKIAKKGSLLILVRGSMLYKRVPICISARDVAFNQDVKALELKGDINNLFLLYLLYAYESTLLELVSATGIGAGKIDTEDLKKMIILIPTQAEQQKIASTLSSIDDLINAQNQKIEALQVHKKGLLQGLFPQMSEIGLSGLNDEQDENT